MKVKKWRFEDGGEQDNEGRYDYYYAGFYYLFSEGDEAFKARRYTHSPNRVSFTGYYQNGSSKNMARYWYGEIPYENHLFIQAVRYLVQQEDVQEVTILMDKGYSQVATERCLETTL